MKSIKPLAGRNDLIMFFLHDRRKINPPWKNIVSSGTLTKFQMQYPVCNLKLCGKLKKDPMTNKKEKKIEINPKKI